MKLLITILLFVIIGCNPAKRLLKNQEAFEKVGQAWAQQHPCVNDTTYITKTDTLVKSDTVELVQYITEPGAYGTDTVKQVVQRIINNRYFYRDSVVSVVPDNRKADAFEKLLHQEREEKAAAAAKADTFQRQFLYALVAAIVLLAALILIVVLKLK